MPDVYEQLREFSWRGISFPVGVTRFDFEHDQTEHRWADRDGASIEATGRGPLVISSHVPMRNNIAPGANETWTGPLYPVVFRSLLAALLDRTSGNLGHPELGTLTCKAKTVGCVWDPSKRDGVDLEIVWRQSTDSSDDLKDVIASPSPIAAAIQAGADLDAQVAEVPALPQPLPSDPSFEESMRSLQAISDQALLASRQVQGVIDRVTYRVQALSDSAVALKDAKLWPVINSSERIKAALYDLQRTMLVATKTISLYETPKDMTFAQLVVATGDKVADLLALNPKLAGRPFVKARTTIRYYA